MSLRRPGLSRLFFMDYLYDVSKNFWSITVLGDRTLNWGITSLRFHSFVFQRWAKALRVWNGMRVTKSWQNLHLTIQKESKIFNVTVQTKLVNKVPTLTANNCRTNISEAFSEMFPTNTVVVGPVLVPVPSSWSLLRVAMVSLVSFWTTGTAVWTNTCDAF